MRKWIPYADPCRFAEFSNNCRFHGCYYEKVSMLFFCTLFVSVAVVAVKEAVLFIPRVVDVYYEYGCICNRYTRPFFFTCMSGSWILAFLRSLLHVHDACMYNIHFMTLPQAVIKPHYFIFVAAECASELYQQYHGKDVPFVYDMRLFFSST